MATFSSVTRQHILSAVEEHDERGASAFAGVYGYTPTPGHTFVHDERTYDSKSVLGVAHKYATGRPASVEELVDAKCDDATILRKHGFVAMAPTPARTTTRSTARSPRATAKRVPGTRSATPAPARRQADPEPVAPVCPTCYMTLPGTGVCDSCA